MKPTSQEQIAIDWWMNLSPAKRQDLKEYYFMTLVVDRVTNRQILEVYRQETHDEI